MSNVQAFIAQLEQAHEKAVSAHTKKSAEVDKIIAKAKKDYDAVVVQAETARAESQTKVDEALSDLNEINGMTAGSKKGPKKGPAKKAAKAAPAVKAVPAKKAAEKTTQSASASAVKGREDVANHKRPPLKDAIRLILAKKTLHTKDIIAELHARKWAPTSGSLKAYVSNILSTHSNFEKLKDQTIFESIKTGKGRGFYRVRPGAPPIKPLTRKLFGGLSNTTTPTTTATKAAPAKKTAAPAKKVAAKAASTSGDGRGCSECGTPGHNKRSHDKFIANGGVPLKAAPAAKAAPKQAAKAAPAAKAAKAAPKRPDQRGCSVEGCGVVGHNKRTHDKYVASQANGHATPKAAPKAKAAAAPKKKGPTVKDSTKAAAPAKAASKTTNGNGAAHVKPGKGQQKCGVEGCGVIGHNKKGHDVWVAKQNGNGKESSHKSTKSASAQASASAPETVASTMSVDDLGAQEKAKVNSSAPVTEANHPEIDAGL